MRTLARRSCRGHLILLIVEARHIAIQSKSVLLVMI
ncbi:hypothetical protein SLEP1_g29035 [Rubroshorea leprosula]|uniref:Uncharacterized protein n=1 Tax=Rubroshorea leprosula TaxID=152421 RepID=A0AAV5JVM8_9ROSI|nr:hypothetical protein SLEP1_g29035 [Rubroshorea leprosula]